MRANIKIVGIGLRRTGTSKKTNKPYDFVPVCFVYPDSNTEGFKAATANMSGEEFDASGIKLNEQREAFIHEYNGSTVIDGII